MLETLAAAFMTATRMDGFCYAGPLAATPPVRRRGSLAARLGAILRRLIG